MPYRAVYKVLPGLLKLYKEVIWLPKNFTPEEIADDSKWYPFFTNYIGALNSTYLLVSVTSGYTR